MLACVVFGVTLYYSLSGRGGTEMPTPLPEETVERYLPDVINARHRFKNGMHILAGEVHVPTACDLLETESLVEVREPREDRVTIRFTTLNEAEVCAQVITSARFKILFNASEDAEIVGTWNGHTVRLNLVEMKSDENIDDFELYFKG